MKKLYALILSTILVLTPTFAAEQQKEFFSSTAGNWTITGVVGEEGEGKLADTSCYTVLDQQPTRVLLGYDLVTEELFMLIHSKEWTSLAVEPPEDPNTQPEGNLFMDFLPSGLEGIVYSRRVAVDRISIRYIDPSTFIPAMLGTTSIKVYSGDVPAITIDLTGIGEAVTVMNDCIVEGRSVVATPSTPKVNA